MYLISVLIAFCINLALGISRAFDDLLKFMIAILLHPVRTTDGIAKSFHSLSTKISKGEGKISPSTSKIKIIIGLGALLLLVHVFRYEPVGKPGAHMVWDRYLHRYCMRNGGELYCQD